MKEEKLNIRKGSFIVCDIQKEYAEHLLSLLSNLFLSEYEFHYFQEIEKAEMFYKDSEVDVLLIDETSYKTSTQMINSKKVFVITEDRESESYPDRIMIFRYQSSDSIIKIFKTALNRMEEQKSKVRKSGVSSQKKGTRKIRDEPTMKGIIGVYSPIHRIGKTSFAIRLGKKIARNTPVLYINMEGYSGENYYFKEGERETLADLLYYIKQERTDYGLKISSMTGQFENMDYIMPMSNEYDLRNVRKEEWLELFQIILDQCIYEVILLDLGDCIDGLYEILERCNKIYMPYISTGISNAKINQYENNLRVSGHVNILKKTVKKQMKTECKV